MLAAKNREILSLPSHFPRTFVYNHKLELVSGIGSTAVQAVIMPMIMLWDERDGSCLKKAGVEGNWNQWLHPLLTTTLPMEHLVDGSLKLNVSYLSSSPPSHFASRVCRLASSAR